MVFGDWLGRFRHHSLAPVRMGQLEKVQKGEWMMRKKEMGLPLFRYLFVVQHPRESTPINGTIRFDVGTGMFQEVAGCAVICIRIPFDRKVRLP